MNAVILDSVNRANILAHPSADDVCFLLSEIEWKAMVTIKVILLGSNNFFAFMKHIAAIITDNKTGRQFLLNYPFGSYDNQDPRAARSEKAMQLYRRLQGGYCARVVHLTSEGDYDEYIHRVASCNKPFSWLGDNCASTINDMLDYFFPSPQLSSLTLLVRLACSCSAYLSFLAPVDFIFSAVLMANQIKTPANIFQKAVMLAERYPAPMLNIPMINQSVNETQPDNSDLTLDEWVINTVYSPLGLI